MTVMNSHLNPWEIKNIWHSQMRMIAPIFPIKCLKYPIICCRSWYRPNVIMFQSIWSRYFAICQTEWNWICWLQIISWCQSLWWTSLTICNQQFLHLFFSVHHWVESFVNECSWLVIVWKLLCIRQNIYVWHNQAFHKSFYSSACYTSVHILE